MAITCCKDCVAPKRHPGCHATCEEYLKQREEAKEEAEAKKQWLNQAKGARFSNYDYDEINYAHCKHHKRNKKYY